MLYGIGISGTGAYIEQARLENVSNNLANLRTPGFKRDLMTFMERPVESLDVLYDDELYKLREYDPLLDKQGGGVQISDVSVEYAQGAHEVTGNDFDFALQGEGFFTLDHTQHGRVYTRAGNFTVNADGDMVTQDGMAFVMDENGQRLNVRELSQAFGASGARIAVAEDGLITVHGANGGSAVTGRRLGVALFDSADEARLAKLGHTLLQPLEGETVAPKALGGSGSMTRVAQGALEMSTSDATVLMTEMVSVSRAFEANLRMLKLQDATLSALIQSVGALPQA